MDDYSLEKALEKVLNEAKWAKRFYAINVKNDWEKIMGKTIAKYTEDLQLQNQELRIWSHNAAFKNQLLLDKEEIIEKVNKFYKKELITKIRIS